MPSSLAYAARRIYIMMANQGKVKLFQPSRDSRGKAADIFY